jgi:predicted dehydrogenase
MRIGMIGTGWVAPQHLDAIAMVPGTEIVAVSGRELGKAEALATPRKAAAYADWRAMIARERLDAVYICVPPGAAAEIAIGCAGRVRGVMVEKPVCVDIGAGERVAAAFRAAGTIGAAAYHNRTRAMAARIAGLCAESRPVAVDAWWHGDMPGVAWWRNRALSGGQMHEQATHLVDLLRRWLGEAVEVSAIASRGRQVSIEGSTIDDAMIATIRFAAGTIATVHTSCIAAPGQDLDNIGLNMRGHGWMARLSGWGMDCRIAQGGKIEELPAEKQPFRLQTEAFVRAVAAGDAGMLPCRFEDGLATARLTEAMGRAAVGGGPVRVGGEASTKAR